MVNESKIDYLMVLFNDKLCNIREIFLNGCSVIKKIWLDNVMLIFKFYINNLKFNNNF